MKNKPLLVAMIMTMMVAGLFLTGGDVKKPKLSHVYDKLVEVYDLVMDNQSKLDEIADTLMSAPSVGAPVEKTGQTKSWDTGDDGDLEKGVVWPNPRFTDNEDGTVTDNLTGLIWLKNANCDGQKEGRPALIFCNELENGSCGLTDGSSAGDWRLPNVKELQSLIDYGFSNPALPDTAGTGKWTDGDPFTNVQTGATTGYYWTSTWPEFDSFSHYYVDVTRGRVSDADSESSYYVWPVRGGN